MDTHVYSGPLIVKVKLKLEEKNYPHGKDLRHRHHRPHRLPVRRHRLLVPLPRRRRRRRPLHPAHHRQSGSV